MKLLLLLLPLVVLCLCGFTEQEESIAAGVGTDTLSHPAVTEEELSGEAPILLWDKLWSIATEAAPAIFGDTAATFGGLMGVLLLCSLIHALRHLSPGSALTEACAFVTVLAVSGVVYGLFRDLFTYTGQALAAFTEYLAALLPVSSSLLIAGGNTSAAAASSAGFSLFLTAISLVCSSVLFPFLQMSFSVGFAAALPGTVDLAPVGNWIRSTSALLLAFLFSLLGFMLTMQTTVSAASDSFLFRTVRFASGVFIPVVGNVLGDAARTVAGSVSVIKGTVGAVGTAVTLGILLPPFLRVAAYRLMLSLCTVLAKLLGCEKEGQLLSQLGGTLNVLLGLLAGTEAITLLYLATFIKTGVAV
ncbi:MAG: hypothetical protein E7651_04760 [Ruminococcaceae bacterium]|nr:hypothetical protein [Oscillospiraceae bacterium]